MACLASMNKADLLLEAKKTAENVRGRKKSEASPWRYHFEIASRTTRSSSTTTEATTSIENYHKTGKRCKVFPKTNWKNNWQLLEQKQQAEYPTFQQHNDIFRSNFVPRRTKNLIKLESSFQQINLNIGPLTAILSYSSATINYVNNIVDRYTYGAKVKTLAMVVGHICIDGITRPNCAFCAL